MYTLTLQINNQAILRSLKKICNAIDGVKILKSSETCSEENAPNATTRKAIYDVRCGNTFKASSTEDLFQQILK